MTGGHRANDDAVDDDDGDDDDSSREWRSRSICCDLCTSTDNGMKPSKVVWRCSVTDAKT